MENHPFLWRRIRRVRRIQVCMARKGLISRITVIYFVKVWPESAWNLSKKKKKNRKVARAEEMDNDFLKLQISNAAMIWRIVSWNFGLAFTQHYRLMIVIVIV